MRFVLIPNDIDVVNDIFSFLSALQYQGDAAEVFGKPEDQEGGSSLTFDFYDNNTYINIRWVRTDYQSAAVQLKYNKRIELIISYPTMCK